MGHNIIHLELRLPDDARVHEVENLIRAWDMVVRQYMPDASLRTRMPMPPPPKPHPTVQ